MYQNNSTEYQSANDSNAILRQIAVQFPDEISWKNNRSYMLGEVSHLREDEVHIRGYIRQNYLNAKRLVHITGLPIQSWHIKRIEIATDPTPVKLSNREKEKVMSTSRAQSIVSSRKSSRRGSFDKNDPMEESKDAGTLKKCVQTVTGAEGDDDQIENNPGLFAAEQTWPTEDEINNKQQRKLSAASEEMMAEAESEVDMAKVIGSYKTKTGGKDASNLAELFDKMQIAVVGRNDGHESDQVSSGSDDEEADEELKTMYEDPNMISQKHLKHSDLEQRAAEDMDFPDEVDTPFTDARVRFQKYRAVRNFKHADWDPYENLPESYSKIWRFQNYQQAQKDSITQTVEEGLPLNGTYITIVLQLDPAKKDS